MHLGLYKIDDQMSMQESRWYLGLGEVDVHRGEGAERAQQNEQQPRREEAQLDAPWQAPPRVPLVKFKKFGKEAEEWYETE